MTIDAPQQATENDPVEAPLPDDRFTLCKDGVLYAVTPEEAVKVKVIVWARVTRTSGAEDWYLSARTDIPDGSRHANPFELNSFDGCLRVRAKVIEGDVDVRVYSRTGWLSQSGFYPSLPDVQARS